jgi:hypothetical protein
VRRPDQQALRLGLLLALTAGALAIPRATLAAPELGTSCSWEVQHVPPAAVDMSDLDARSATDVWGVGRRSSDTGRAVAPLILHRDGSGWTRVPSPRISQYVSLVAVDAYAADDVWAVGGWDDPQRRECPCQLFEHWNGVRWRVVDPPDHHLGSVHDVAVVSPDDVWAVGNRFRPGSGLIGLVWHWNGSAWSRVEAPAVSDYGSVDVGAGRVVIMGDEYGPESFEVRAAIFRMVATGWHRLRIDGSLDPTGYLSHLQTGWAVGGRDALSGQPWVVHRTDGGLVTVPLPDPTERANLMALAVIADDDVWAFGERWVPVDPDGYFVPEILHRDGASWTSSQPPAPFADDQGQIGAATVAPDSGEVIVGGYVIHDREVTPLVLSRCS